MSLMHPTKGSPEYHDCSIIDEMVHQIIVVSFLGLFCCPWVLEGPMGKPCQNLLRTYGGPRAISQAKHTYWTEFGGLVRMEAFLNWRDEPGTHCLGKTLARLNAMQHSNSFSGRAGGKADLLTPSGPAAVRFFLLETACCHCARVIRWNGISLAGNGRKLAISQESCACAYSICSSTSLGTVAASHACCRRTHLDRWDLQAPRILG